MLDPVDVRVKAGCPFYVAGAIGKLEEISEVRGRSAPYDMLYWVRLPKAKTAYPLYVEEFDYV